MSQSNSSLCNVEKPAVLSLMPHQNFGSPEPQNGPKGPKNLNFEPPSPLFFSTTVSQIIENTAKMRGLKFLKKYAFFEMCTFPQVKGTFLTHDISNDMHFWSIHWVI